MTVAVAKTMQASGSEAQMLAVSKLKFSTLTATARFPSRPLISNGWGKKDKENHHESQVSVPCLGCHCTEPFHLFKAALVQDCVSGYI